MKRYFQSLLGPRSKQPQRKGRPALNNTFQPTLESLEERQLLAGNVFLYGGYGGNTLYIQGDAYDDMATISLINNGNLVVVDLACSSDTTRYEHYRQFITTRADLRQIVFEGYQGNDEFYNYSDVNTVLYGHSGNDILYGGTGYDIIYGGSNDDEIHAGYWSPSGDYLNGGDGHDRLYGSIGNDYMLGGYGNDVLKGFSGNDSLYGDNGVDILEGGSDNDYLDGGYDGMTDYLYGEAGYDTYAIHQTYRSYTLWGSSYSWWEQDPDWSYDSDSNYSFDYRYHGVLAYSRILDTSYRYTW